jgi:hypothetical protein
MVAVVSPIRKPLPIRLPVRPNAVQRKQPLGAANDADTLLEKVLALAFDAFGIFLLDALIFPIACDLAITSNPGTQHACHTLRFRALCFGGIRPSLALYGVITSACFREGGHHG